MLRQAAFLLICLLLTACASDEAMLYSRINEAYDFEVTHCDSFALVTGIGRGETGLSDAQNSAKKQGEELLGTHIVWLHVDHIENSDQTRVVAVVYKCLI
ncbi:hypothetical protein [Shewanella colwelliana]|uniref:hypothetical protein n=1 Tax=Shewanella colwelliana TaxID=23 RepID=UPI0039C85546